MMVFDKSLELGIFPVPIDQIGSYATRILFLLNFFSSDLESCFFNILNVWLFFFEAYFLLCKKSLLNYFSGQI